ncbi:MAG: aminomethyl-transferring glycine dehydrogenase subunit GcvPA [Chloroflexi bacterium]|nr:aminomethyl-transferring glycine dehydrogenase subunit GcvPA [Chloroflexota bacterium]MCL5075327.1 aminomethyl-transferring glycine dehydrogenase subunit GcvPA [Chloroflexota bacterium]
MGYTVNTDAGRQAMLEVIGSTTIDDLFDDIPEVLHNPPLHLPSPLAEMQVKRLLREIAERSWDLEHYPSFLGAGAYRHFTPSVVEHILARGEFYTAYTPYQPEISQGTLQAIYEYQTLICQLTGMDVANASHYDGATALAEAAIMACKVTGRSKVVVAPGVHPEYQTVLRTYTAGLPLEVIGIKPVREDGLSIALDPAVISDLIDTQVACLVVQQPNFFGYLEEVSGLSELIHAAGGLFVVCVDPISLGLLVPPAAYGADIVVAEGQPLGMSLSFGGPYLGIFACRERFLRQMPGRIVGQAIDAKGQRGFVLTVQTREQHIRREKATSNICSNEALCALAATVYLSALGKAGLRLVAELCLQKAHYAARQIAQISGFTLPVSAPFFKEFVVKCPVPAGEVNQRLLARRIIGGHVLGRSYPELSDYWLMCVTETNTREEIDTLVAVLRDEFGR